MDTTRPQTLRARPGRFGSRGPLARLGLVLVLGLLLAPAAQASDPTTKCGIARMALDARRAQDELRCIVDRHVALVRGSSIADSYAAYQECRIAIQTRFEERATRLDERDEQRGRCALPSSYSLGSSIALEYGITLESARSSQQTLGTMLITAGIGMPCVLSYTLVIYWVFRGKVKLDSSSY